MIRDPFRCFELSSVSGHSGPPKEAQAHATLKTVSRRTSTFANGTPSYGILRRSFYASPEYRAR